MSRWLPLKYMTFWILEERCRCASICRSFPEIGNLHYMTFERAGDTRLALAALYCQFFSWRSSKCRTVVCGFGVGTRCRSSRLYLPVTARLVHATTQSRFSTTAVRLEATMVVSREFAGWKKCTYGRVESPTQGPRLTQARKNSCYHGDKTNIILQCLEQGFLHLSRRDYC